MWYLWSTVVKLIDAGALIGLSGRDGMVHVSQVVVSSSTGCINHISDVLKEGQESPSIGNWIDRQGRIRVTMKDVENLENASFIERVM